MKILMLTTNSSLMDGINRHILTISTQLNSLDGCEVAVCTVFPKAELNTELESCGVRTYSLNASNGHDFKIFGSFHKVMQSFKPDVVHSHVMALFEKMVLSSCFKKTKYVGTIHGISDKVEHLTFNMRLERFLDRIFPIKYDAICMISNGVREHFSNNTNCEKIVTVYNPILFPENTIKQYRLHKLLGLSKETPIIGTACRLAQVKNPIAFTNVMCKVLQQNSSAHAVVMGDGDSGIKKQLDKIVKTYGVESRFHWLGYRQDAPELVKDLSCFVMTSISEGLPTSLLEAMANRTPFAMMEGNGGLKDITQINTEEGPIGLVVPKGDDVTMAAKISYLLGDEIMQTELAENAYVVGKKYFNVASVCNKLFNLYKQLCVQ